MNRTVTVLALLCAGTAGAVFAGSPYWTWHEIHAAADADDHDTLMSFFDASSVREGFVIQANEILTKGSAERDDQGGPTDAMEAMMLPKLAEAAASQLLTPDHLASLIKNGQPKPTALGQQKPVTYDLSYRSLNGFVITVSVPNQQPATLSLERRGLFNWMVVRVGTPVFSTPNDQATITARNDSEPQVTPATRSPATSSAKIQPAAASIDPDFARYPAASSSPSFVAPAFQGAQGKYADFRTVLAQAARRGANFAGHYAIAQVGCGTECSSAMVIDGNTGTVTDFPLGGEDYPSLDLRYRADSNLIKAYWETDDPDMCKEADYIIKGLTFRQLPPATTQGSCPPYDPGTSRD